MDITMPRPVAAATVVFAVWTALAALVAGPWLLAMISYRAPLGYLGAVVLVALPAIVVTIIRGWRWAPYAGLLFPLCPALFTIAALAHEGRLSLTAIIGGGCALLLAGAAGMLHLPTSRPYFSG